MQDGIIAGNGNSRYLKTVAAALSLYPDYESFMAALIAGTFPIDLNGINAGGWTQQGTPLNKANLFSDSTASALGLTASNTPNDALEKIKALIDAANTNANTKTVTQQGSYVGTGTSTVEISLPFAIKILVIYAHKNSSTDRPQYSSRSIMISPIISFSDSYSEYIYPHFNNTETITEIIWNDGNKKVSLYGTDDINLSGFTYYYYAIG